MLPNLLQHFGSPIGGNVAVDAVLAPIQLNSRWKSCFELAISFAAPEPPMSQTPFQPCLVAN